MIKIEWSRWGNRDFLPPFEYVCGHCGNKVASDLGFKTTEDERGSRAYIYICPNCGLPTIALFREDNLVWKYPEELAGRDIQGLPDDIQGIYDEARRCIKEKCYTASVLLLRKMIMHIAVSKGAEEGKSFLNYIEFLEEKGFLPPGGKEWVNYIRKKGNEASHEIVLFNKEESEQLLIFTEMLLRFIYEFPGMLNIEE